jgi:hypothetical protein
MPRTTGRARAPAVADAAPGTRGAAGFLAPSDGFFTRGHGRALAGQAGRFEPSWRHRDARSAPPQHAARARAGAGTAEADRMAAWRLAVRLSLGSAIALGLARFSYALLLPPMKADLGWSFAEAGALNTANAAGYLLGALVFPLLSRRWRAGTLLTAGCVLTVSLMAACGLVSGTDALLAARVATGSGSALIFISGGVLAARLASRRHATPGCCSACTTAAPAGGSSRRRCSCPRRSCIARTAGSRPGSRSHSLACCSRRRPCRPRAASSTRTRQPPCDATPPRRPRSPAPRASRSRSRATGCSASATSAT